MHLRRAAAPPAGLIVYRSAQTTTGTAFGIDELFTGVFLNRGDSYDEERERRRRDREALFKAIAEMRRRVMTASHRVPPVAV